MIYVKTGQLKAGVILARPAMDRDGNVLIEAGRALTAREITLLRTQRVDGVFIGAGAPTANLDPDPGPAPGSPEFEAALRMRFRHLDTAHPFTQELMRVCMQRAQLLGADTDAQDH